MSGFIVLMADGVPRTVSDRTDPPPDLASCIRRLIIRYSPRKRGAVSCPGQQRECHQSPIPALYFGAGRHFLDYMLDPFIGCVVLFHGPIFPISSS
jgi:hypothetical protein